MENQTEAKPPTRNEYANKEFWNSRFSEEQRYDWYITWKELKPYFEQLGIPADAAILNVGCGNSPITLEMWRDGLTNITNIDISDKAIQVMKQQAESQGIGGQWLEMDATKMSFESNSFDVVFDKGTLDALVCGDDKDIPLDLVREMFRVCKPGGSIFLITHSTPELRRKFLAQCLPEESAAIDYCQQSLCSEVNMVNIMRFVGGGKPLREVVRDPTLFTQVLLEMNKDNEESNKVGGDWRRYSWTEKGEIESGLLDLKKHELEKKKETEAKVAESKEETTEGTETTDKTGESKVEGEISEKKEVSKDAHRVPRQNYCFVYKINKLA